MRAKFQFQFVVSCGCREQVFSGNRRWWIHNPLKQLDMVSARGVAQALGQQAGVDPKILKLAAKYRMNNDVKRAVFCIIFSAEDYMDAFERISKLALKGADWLAELV